MRGLNKTLAAVSIVGLAATMAACSSDGDSKKSDSKPVVSVAKLTGETTTVIPAASFAKALGQLKVALAPLGTAKANSDGSVSFPITGGNATVYPPGSRTPYVTGEIDHQGSGLSLTAGGKKVSLENFVVDPGNNSKLTGDVSLNGKTVKDGVKLFDLDGSTLKTPSVDKSTGVATLQGTTIYLSTDAATLLNSTFGITALKGGSKTGTLIGTAVIKAKG